MTQLHETTQHEEYLCFYLCTYLFHNAGDQIQDLQPARKVIYSLVLVLVPLGLAFDGNGF